MVNVRKTKAEANFRRMKRPGPASHWRVWVTASVSTIFGVFLRKRKIIYKTIKEKRFRFPLICGGDSLKVCVFAFERGKTNTPKGSRVNFYGSPLEG